MQYNCVIDFKIELPADMSPTGFPK